MVSLLLFTVITIAEPHLLLDSYYSLRWFLLISHGGIDLNWITIGDLTFLLSRSIFPSPKYYSNNIPWTLSRCQYSRTSMPTTTGSTTLAAQINKFDRRGINSSASAFSVKSAEITPDGACQTRTNRIHISSSTC